MQPSRTLPLLFVAVLISAGKISHHALADTAQAGPEQTIQSFKAHIPDAVLADLRRRLEMAKWPDQLPGTTWDNGPDLSEMRSLASYWQKTYDWRAQEERINRFDQFTTEIDGQRIHFIHQRSPRAEATPLLLIHGWPGSMVEFLEMIEPLTHPKGSNVPAFHVIIPSLPGFGFSGPTKASGWDARRMARALVALMARLGYSRYGIHGGDWGSIIGQHMARQVPDRVIGLHVTFLPVSPPTSGAMATLTDEERRRYSTFGKEESGFFRLQETRPQTPAYALTDSPTGWLAWVAAIFHAGTDHDGDFLTAVNRDAFLTNVTLYWVTGTVGSSMRIYREENLRNGGTAPPPRIEIPVAYAVFPKEVIAAPDRWIKPGYNIVRETVMPRGGHFAGLEQPDLLINDIRLFFAKLKK
jgi:pimeloyl-ACP methyl ester carboxylesterase